MLELLKNSELVHKLLTGMQDGLAIVDHHGVKIFVNDAMCQLTGFSREELLGTNAPFPYWPPEEYTVINDAFKRSLSGEFKTFELIFCSKTGDRFPVLVSPSMLPGPDGLPVAFVATVKDISERKKLEQAVMKSEQRWRSIAENPFDFVVVIDRSYRYLYVNHTAPGITQEELLGKATPFDFTPPEYNDVMREAFDNAFNHGRAASYDVYVGMLDRWFSTIVGPIREHGEIIALSLLTREITEQKRAEEALRKSELHLREVHKMETIGTLASGIAHDLNNLLTPILAHSEMALTKLTVQHELHSKLKIINLAANNARDLVQRILLFSRQQTPKKERVDLTQRIRESIALFNSTVPITIHIQLALPDTPLWILADKTQIDQVLANVTTNALHAMRANRNTDNLLQFSASTVVAAPENMVVSQADGYVVLAVRDSGVGMNEETLRRAFDPFFTTKPTGSGTGLGLSIVQGIIREHGGDTIIQSAVGKGTTCTIYLPLTSAPQARVSTTASKNTAPNAALRILCVDDEPLVSEVVQVALSNYGHQVLVVARAMEAIELITDSSQHFDMLLTDYKMPHMTGIDLIKKIRAIDPNLPCLLMTGLDAANTAQMAHDLNIADVLIKPFTIDQLLTVVNRITPAK